MEAHSRRSTRLAHRTHERARLAAAEDLVGLAEAATALADEAGGVHGDGEEMVDEDEDESEEDEEQPEEEDAETGEEDEDESEEDEEVDGEVDEEDEEDEAGLDGGDLPPSDDLRSFIFLDGREGAKKWHLKSMKVPREVRLALIASRMGAPLCSLRAASLSHLSSRVWCARDSGADAPLHGEGHHRHQGRVGGPRKPLVQGGDGRRAHDVGGVPGRRGARRSTTGALVLSCGTSMCMRDGLRQCLSQRCSPRRFGRSRSLGCRVRLVGASTTAGTLAAGSDREESVAAYGTVKTKAAEGQRERYGCRLSTPGDVPVDYSDFIVTLETLETLETF